MENQISNHIRQGDSRRRTRRATRFSIIWKRPDDSELGINERREHRRFSIWPTKQTSEKKMVNNKNSNIDNRINVDKIDVFMNRNEEELNVNLEDEKSQKNIFQRLGSELFFKRPSTVLEEKKEEEEEDDESESWIYTLYRFFFPDNGPVIWLVFLLFSSIIAYVNSLIENSHFFDTGKSCLIIFLMDFATYLLMIILRLIIFRYILPWLCPEGRIFAALSGTADPELIYCVWAGEISLLWKLQLVLKEDNSGYNIPFIIGSNNLSLSSGVIIIKARLMVLIFAIRRLILAFIMFFFMLDFIGSMSKLLIEFLLKYRFLRQINCNWTKLRPHIVEGLRVFPNQTNRFLFSKFSSKNRLKEKPMNRGDSITLPYFLTEEGMAQIKKKKYQNWLAVQFVKQYSALFYYDNQFIEVKNKKDARKYAKLLFNDMAEHSNEILIFMGKWKYKHKINDFKESRESESQENKHAAEAIESPSILDNYEIQSLPSVESSSSDLDEKISMFYENKSNIDDRTAWDTAININDITAYESNINPTGINNKCENDSLEKADHNDELSLDNKKISILRAEEFKTISSEEDKSKIEKKQTQPSIFGHNNRKDREYMRKTKRFNSFIPTAPYGVMNIDDFCLFEEESDKPLVLDIEVLKVLYGNSIETFLKKIDPTGRDSYNEDDWVRLLVTMYETRKKMINTLESQEGIAKVFKRMVSIVLWFFSFIFILIILGVNVNTLVISGAAVISSISVALNRFYSNFVSSVIFVVFENPYNQGDRIRINSGPVITVRKIRTFCTIFSTVESVPIMYPNYWLIDQSISNESRAIESCHIITFYMSDLTSPFVFDSLTKSLKQYANDRPRDFIKNSVYVYIHSIQPGHYIETRVSFSNVNPTYEWEKLLEIRTPFYLFILHVLRQHNVEYFLPENRVIYSTWTERTKRRSNQAFRDIPSCVSNNLLNTHKKKNN